MHKPAPAQHTKGISLSLSLSLSTRLYSWLLNPVGGEEHSITVVNLLLHGFLPDPEHSDRQQGKKTKKQENSARVKRCPEVTLSPGTVFYTFGSLRTRK